MEDFCAQYAIYKFPAICKGITIFKPVCVGNRLFLDWSIISLAVGCRHRVIPDTLDNGAAHRCVCTPEEIDRGGDGVQVLDGCKGGVDGFFGVTAADGMVFAARTRRERALEQAVVHRERSVVVVPAHETASIGREPTDGGRNHTVINAYITTAETGQATSFLYIARNGAAHRKVLDRGTLYV